MEKYELIIIGGGAGAFAAAIKANELKAKTAMVNTGLPLGGTCVNVGCVPSKALLWAGEVMHQAKHHSIPGIDIEVKNFDFAKVVQDELALVEKLRAEKYEYVLNELEHVTHIDGKAIFISPNEIEVNGQKLFAKKFIIATGSRFAVPPIEGIREAGYFTHIEALKVEKQPQELIVIGAGAVGLEFVQIYARFGTKVTILHRRSSIFRPAEEELSNRLAEILTQEGITIKTNVKVQKASRENNKKVILYEVNGKQEEVRGDEILLAVGKTPNTQELALKRVGVDVDDKQAIKINQYFQTSQSHIFAVGDVTNAPLRLEPTAGREGTLATENALLDKQNNIDYTTVPWTIFTDPQLAGVGLTEEQVIEQFGSCLCRTISFEDVPKAIIMKRTEGLIKIVVHPVTKVILGVQILAPHAGELIAQAMTIVKNKNTIDDVVNSLPMFPTLSEALKIAALSFTSDIKNLTCCV